jgi:prepilin signal peptidase PulO-like enzyme (type II secretory pathway)
LDLASIWLLPIAIVGAAVGSFVNVAIYRLPIGLALWRPTWSFCPNCQTRILARHNVPVFGWLWLSGRCHACRKPIAAMYPLVECSMAIIFVAIWDAMFVSKIANAGGTPASDWPLFVAFAAFYAGLLASTVMDLETYTIDIRIALFMLIVGAASHAIHGWVGASPMPAAICASDLPPMIAAIGLVMGCAWLVVWLWSLFRSKGDAQDLSDPPPTQTEALAENSTAVDQAVTLKRALPVILLALAMTAMLLWIALFPSKPVTATLTAGAIRGIVVVALLLFMLILLSLQPRPADEEIVTDIEAGRPRARQDSLREFASFIPALAVGIVAFWLLRSNGKLGMSWADLLGSTSGPSAAGRLFQSLGSAAWGAILGWTVRILGTMAFGKEAFGTGDIYLLAAMSAVLGFWSCLFAFFVGSILALVCVSAMIFHKSSRAIPFGPWLALGSLAVLWVKGALLAFFGPAGSWMWDAMK